ncbi:hypothetical protein PENTCL1PPCAC_9807 [Pristionchus entomophagus]|uniref:Secreted protein n=1 Tax=Pristionchus entomophagus TaxID=358040 RepID=A0AAV5SZ66_9BILA|nr:hypothetical protein PENTCL1PPCAC_9807 [Pristionchus entomophagus]
MAQFVGHSSTEKCPVLCFLLCMIIRESCAEKHSALPHSSFLLCTKCLCASAYFRPICCDLFDNQRHPAESAVSSNCCMCIAYSLLDSEPRHTVNNSAN